MAGLDTLVNPPFANDPPVKLNLDAKMVGLFVAVLAAITALNSILALSGLLGFVGGPASVRGLYFLALVGDIVSLVAGVMAAVGGWQMYKANESGKRLVIFGLAIAFVVDIVLMIGFSAGGAILQLILLAIVYYVVVVSRYPGEAPSAGASRGL